MAYGLRDALLARGWHSHAESCNNVKGVQVWTNIEHVALTLGNGKLDQHNPNHCSTNCDWDSYNILINPKWSLAEAMVESPVETIVEETEAFLQ